MAFRAANNDSIGSLLTRIKGAKGISDITRNELTKRASISPGSFTTEIFQGIESELAQAIEGRAPKFKERQLRQEQQKLVADRPGRRQTILTSGANRGRTQQVGSMLTGKLGAV